MPKNKLRDIDKKIMIQNIVDRLNVDLAAMSHAAAVARDAAINEESKSEDKHDTRSIEAGYLAGAQRKRVSELKELITFFKFLEPRAFRPDEKISATALVEVESDEHILCYFMVPKGGGLSTTMGSVQIQTITPQTPLGEGLLGLQEGEVLNLEVKNKIREYEIIAIA